MRKPCFLLITACIYMVHSVAQQQTGAGYMFTAEKQIPTTSVKDQGRSGTCWSFSTTSFVESEILRLTRKEYDLSEMYFVYSTYLDKALQYIRFHGNIHYSQGGQAHDVFNVISRFGMVPEKDFTGEKDSLGTYNHNALEQDLLSLITRFASNENGISLDWKDKADSIVQHYLGRLPDQCQTDRGSQTPIEFFTTTGLKPDDYIELTSFTHHPFYEQFILEVPDNWALEKYYNLPLNELMKVMNNALDNGYSIVWDGDVSERGYSNLLGIAVLPLVDWEKMDPIKAKEVLSSPHDELDVTQEIRQKGFDNHVTTDDHLMHITGTAKDQNGTKYYITKNSWGPESGPYNGYIYLSEAYIKMKTIAIFVHKDAIPKEIAAKLKL